MSNLAMIARECNCALVVDVEHGWFRLFVAQFGQNIAEEDCVFGAFDSCDTSVSVELSVTIFCFWLRAWKTPVPSPNVKWIPECDFESACVRNAASE